MLKFSGFGWDEARGMPTADDDVFQKYIEANPRAKEFRYKPFKYYKEFRDVFAAGRSATGAGAAPPSQPTVLPNGSGDEEPIDVSSEDETPPFGTQHSLSAVQGANKRKRFRRPQSAGQPIAEALLELGKSATALSGQDTCDRAVEVALEDYKNLPARKKMRLLRLLENNTKATIFLAIGPGELRDGWVDFNDQDKNELVMDIVLEEYKNLPVPKQLRLLLLLENEAKITHFLRIGSGELRDRWVDFHCR